MTRFSRLNESFCLNSSATWSFMTDRNALEKKELTNGKTLSLMTELRSQKIWKMVQRFQNDNQLKSELQSRADEECHIKYGRNAD